MINILKTYLKITHLATSLLLILILFLNMRLWHLASIGVIFGILLFYLFSKRLGNWLFAEEKRTVNYLFGFLILILLFSIVGTVFYYLYSLNDYAILIILVLMAIFTSFTPKQKKTQSFIPIQEPIRWSLKLLLAAYYLLLITDFYQLFTHQITSAIKTPWEVLPSYFFILYFLTALTLIVIVIYDNKKFRPLFLIMLFAFLSSSVALFVYKLGYGFDPFIHQATEKIIMLKGLILPKPFYYIGQYSIVVIIAKILQTSVEWTDKLLVPILASVFIPLSIYTVCQKIFHDKLSRIYPLLFSSIPFAIFIMTTPQNLANTLLLILIAFGLLNIYKPSKYLLLILLVLTLSILAIHPLSGIPALIFFILIFLFTFQPKKVKKNTPLIIVFSIISCLALPAVFLVNSGFNLSKLKYNSANIVNLIDLFKVFHFKSFNFISDFIYLYEYLLFFIIIILSIVSLIILYYKLKAISYKPLIYPLTTLILLTNYIILKLFIDFNFVISYEQGAYAQRVLEISFYFLIPFALFIVYLVLKKIIRSSIAIKLFTTVLLAGILTSSFYLSYPCYDDYEQSHFRNLTKTDLNTVKFIEQVSDTKKYIVLANQMVSAGALKEFGFDKYYNGLYYYPIPTSSPLYEYYLRMVYEKPARGTMLEAMNKMNVPESYLVVNDYWTNFVKLTEQAKTEADQWWDLEDGKVFIFQYKK